MDMHPDVWFGWREGRVVSRLFAENWQQDKMLIGCENTAPKVHCTIRNTQQFQIALIPGKPQACSSIIERFDMHLLLLVHL